MVKDFLIKLGGVAEVSRELKVPLPTVSAWGQRNRVPHWRVPALLALAIRKGKPIPDTLRDAV